VEQTRAVTLPDGRTLTGRTWGPPAGRPVLLVAGAGTGSAMPFGEHELARRGVRLLTMDRPGAGGSTPDPGRTAASTAADYAAFAAAVTGDAGPLPVVASSQGALFGLAIAAAGGASALVLVSPADEVAHPAVAALLPEHPRALADLARTAPDAARAVLGRMTPASMAAMVLDGAVPADRAVYREPGFLARYRAALAEGFAGDGAGYVADTMLAMRTWQVDLGAVRVPTTVLIGEHDGWHSPDMGRTLTARIPGAVRHVVAGAGGALLWSRPGLVLDAATGASVPGPGVTGSGVVLRPASPPDTAAVVRVWRRAVEATHHFLAAGDVDRYEAVVRAALPDLPVVVAERAGVVAGFAAGHEGRVEMLFVDPDAHGTGVGTALLARVTATWPVVDLDVNEDNPGARAFYEHRGFVVAGRSAVDGEGRPYPLLHLRRARGAGGADA
jgi:pimeloyl-ACP methyl ester carboxylesterase/ribosomal protein S18 acetylase RimI-like enzyme